MRFTIFIMSLLVIAGTSRAEGKKFDVQKEINDAKRRVMHAEPGFGLVGTVERGRETSYSINGEDFSVTPRTEIVGDLKLGKQAQATGIFAGGKKVAETIVVAEPMQSTEPDPGNEKTFHLR